MASSDITEVNALLSIIDGAVQITSYEYATHGTDIPNIYSLKTHSLDPAEDNIALGEIIRTLEGACYQLCATLAPPSHTLHKTTVNKLHDCLSFALEAKVADIIAEHPRGIHVRDVAEPVGAEEKKLDRILRRLSAQSFFHEVSPHVYAPSRLTYPLLTSDVAYMPHMMMSPALPVFYSTITSPKLEKSYDPKDAAMVQGINSGISLEKDKYNSCYHWIGSDPTRRALFHRAMIGLEKVHGRLNILHRYPWSNISIVCDVGSGIGAFSMALAKSYPQIKFTLFDLPEIIMEAKLTWKKDYPEALQHDESPGRVPFPSGNFLKELNVYNYDVYYLRNILHNWSNEDCCIILRNIRKAMGDNPNSRVLIQDFVIQYGIPAKPEGNVLGGQNNTGEALINAPYPMPPNPGAGSSINFDTDIFMLLYFNGQECLVDEFMVIANDAGLQFVRIWDLGGSALMEFKARDTKTSEP